jgi:hypothetical protein
MRKLKKTLLNYLVAIFSKSAFQEVVRQTAVTSIKSVFITNDKNPYLSINSKVKEENVVFISGRFRSGSTLLWNIFRHIDTCTAYYEPFNERKWFLNDSRGDFVDQAHKGVSDYWSEYDDLDYLAEFYSEDWIRKELFMDESSWNISMEKYIDALILNSDGLPVLQFNRVDFRLPWLRHRYPKCKIIHIYRHPREQWLSSLSDKKIMNKDDVLITYKDSFYLNSWCKDLEIHFPLLSISTTPHPYMRFYYLWKLSYLYGKKDADLSISFESLANDSEEILQSVLGVLNIENVSLSHALNLIQAQDFDKWKGYADDQWFSEMEAECEYQLDKFLK